MDVSSFLHVDTLQTLLLCLVIFCCLTWYAVKSNRNTPPGPFSWPIFRNIPTLILSIVYYKEQTHDLMTRLSKKYGKIFMFDMGIGSTNRVVILNDVKLIKEAFQKLELSYRPPVPSELGEFARGRGKFLLKQYYMFFWNLNVAKCNRKCCREYKQTFIRLKIPAEMVGNNTLAKMSSIDHKFRKYHKWGRLGYKTL